MFNGDLVPPQNTGCGVPSDAASKAFTFFTRMREPMTSKRLISVIVVLMLCGTARSSASGFVGIYGIIEKVVFEPNEEEPERVQVWGAFAYTDGSGGKSLTVSSVKRGYLYFRLPLAREGA